MKKSFAIGVIVLAVGLTACSRINQRTYSADTAQTGQTGQAEPESGETAQADQAAERSFFNAESSIFTTIEQGGGDEIYADFEVYLAETDAVFLVVESAEDMEAVMHYTYSTNDRKGAKLGYYSDVEKTPVMIELKAATEPVYGGFWIDRDVVLKKGKNIFFLSGQDITCKMRFELVDFEKDKILGKGLSLED